MGRKRKIFLDTNAVIYYLKGIKGFEVLGNHKTFYYSFMTTIELLSYGDDESRQIILDFLKKGKRININKKIIAETIEIRRHNRLKIPDAIIVASSKIVGADLFTSDEEILKKIDFLNIFDLLESSRSSRAVDS
jgi:predicted nucleic acid-binding protein